MVTTLIMDTDEPFVDRNTNDFIQYNKRAESDSDSDFDDFGNDTWVAKMLHDDHPAVRIAHIARGFKAKCDAVLSQTGVFKPQLKIDHTGKCSSCGEMKDVMSQFAKVETAAAAGCPSCNILMQAIKKYIPDKSALSSSKLGIKNSWNSGCAGRQFIRTNNISASQPGAMGVIAMLDGSRDLMNIRTKMKEVWSEILTELNLFGVQGPDQSLLSDCLPDPTF